ncbi:MAG: hypothetical protein A2848_02160 [Candidatus Magasanikbacteria bacterium RIFCSPHIGHO2_01_FULL_50_8]|uniref:Uncharacterized protein n=2 Tax=Candidatus Magasanikiibacteriota TaxID=1752731 RepID=A0A1F6LR79_9BACT|nr:MAG: hypothetical protein A2848_02160 [Candidatus Magasanikbacteria bacterium RIFCSPHIGHO2_01_FULL_50_8]OGH67703.1 MAG: hypothetical protein A3C15_02735 [Candidatus Magasanikbacteria bacterium RIFCSPHIGHO2_02_FULL_50_9b]
MQTLRTESDKFRAEVTKQVSTYILAGFGIVAGLAWNEAIRSLIDYIYPLPQNGVQAKFLYAVVITIVVILVSMAVLRSNRAHDKKSRHD